MGRARRREDRDRQGDSGDAASRELPRSSAIASRDGERDAPQRRHSGFAKRLRLVRGAARRPRHRRRLQPAAQSPARALDDPRGGSRQARALREADRAQRGRGAPADRSARPHRRADSGSVHGAHASAVADSPRARSRAGASATLRSMLGLLQLLQRRCGEHPQHPRVRRRRR